MASSQTNLPRPLVQLETSEGIETVEWSYRTNGERMELTSKLRNWTTTRMWQLNEMGDDVESRKAYFIDQMERAKHDLIERLEFWYKQKYGEAPTVKELPIKWLN